MRRLHCLIVLLLVPAGTHACLWDYDTLKQERARFPETLEIITGKFLRHSPEFYEWRIKDRLGKLMTDPHNPALFDDLAVAYAKTGQYAKAIEMMEAVEKFAPGRYETYSNLGTFHFLAGDIAKALPIIDKALAINPDAHFGREKYQRWLGEYLLVNPARTLPVSPSPGPILPHRDRSFAVFLRTKLDKDKLDLDDLRPAITGVLGMMRFANHENPILLEVLGDLMAHNAYDAASTEKRLAARAYLRASQVSDARARAGYRQLAEDALTLQTRGPASQVQLTIEEVDRQLELEMKDANQWYDGLKAKEADWISSGADADAEFDRLYAEEPRVPDEAMDDELTWAQRNRIQLLAIGAATCLSLVIFAAIFVLCRVARPHD